MRPALRFSRSLLPITLLTLTFVLAPLAPSAALAQAPVVSAPVTLESKVGCTVTIQVTATAAPGKTITSLTAESPILSLLGGTFTTNASNTEGTLLWFVQVAGTFTIDFTALDSDGLTGSAQTNLFISQGPDDPPVIFAPSSVSGTEGQQLCFTVSAVDPDGDPVQLQQPSPIPFGATFVIGPPAQGTFCWTPGLNDAGNHVVNICATSITCYGDSVTTCRSVPMTIQDSDNPPVVTAPPTVSKLPGCLLTFTVTATAAPGRTLTSLTAAGTAITAGATFTANAANTEGTLSWQIPITAAGAFSVTFRAIDSDGIEGSASTAIAVLQSDRAPVIVAPTTVTGTEGLQFCFSVSAVDPDGDPVQLQPPNPIPQGATFVIGPPNQGTFCWTPGFTQAGSYTVTICAVSTSCAGSSLSGCATVAIMIGDFNRPPVLATIGDLSVGAGETLDHPLSGSDPEGAALTFSKGSGPFYVTVTTTGPTTGNLRAAPGLADVGSSQVTVLLSDGASFDGEIFTLTVTPCVCPPVADAGGPYLGFTGVALEFDGSGSSDPLGSPLTYAWDFGDGATGTGVQPVHTYAVDGTYMVTLTVLNNRGQANSDSATASIGGPPPATAFTTGGNGTVRLASSKPKNCVRIEPLGGAFQVEDVDLGSVVMISPGTGSVGQIPAITGKTSVTSDANNNGVAEIEACFAKDDLRQLFSNLPSGPNVVTVAIEGNLSFGAHFTAQLTLTVHGTGGALASSFRFDPQTSEGVLTFVTSGAGSARVHFFDARGRLVRTLLDAPSLPAGAHDVRVQARAGGAPLAAGIYFYRVVTPEGTAEGRALVLK